MNRLAVDDDDSGVGHARAERSPSARADVSRRGQAGRVVAQRERSENRVAFGAARRERVFEVFAAALGFTQGELRERKSRRALAPMDVVWNVRVPPRRPRGSKWRRGARPQSASRFELEPSVEPRVERAEQGVQPRCAPSLEAEMCA